MAENKHYQEIKIDTNGYGGPRFRYSNPLTGAYQYEYALVREISGLFKAVITNSMCIERLKLYFRELPIEKPEEKKDINLTNDSSGGKNKKTDKRVMSEIKDLVNRDVIGKVRFPLMHECMAELLVMPKEDGKHIFIFTDGIYSFSIELMSNKKNKPYGIRVKEMNVADEQYNKGEGDEIMYCNYSQVTEKAA